MKDSKYYGELYLRLCEMWMDELTEVDGEAAMIERHPRDVQFERVLRKIHVRMHRAMGMTWSPVYERGY